MSTHTPPLTVRLCPSARCYNYILHRVFTLTPRNQYQYTELNSQNSASATPYTLHLPSLLLAFTLQAGGFQVDTDALTLTLPAVSVSTMLQLHLCFNYILYRMFGHSSWEFALLVAIMHSRETSEDTTTPTQFLNINISTRELKW